MDTNLVAYAVSAILGGGLFKGITALWKAITESREKKTLSDSIGAKTPAEVESMSVTTMVTALKSAQARIQSLEAERVSDRDYYHTRIKDLNDQLTTLRRELTAMEERLSALLAETDPQQGRDGSQ